MTPLPIPLHAPLLSSVSGITHGFWGTQGGVSQGRFASLNCAYGVGDATENVDQNRSRILQALQAPPPASLITLNQVHGARVHVVDPAFMATYNAACPPEGDALVTQMTGVPLGILTADCLPMLWVDPEAGIIGASHGGWKGLLAGIVPQTYAALLALGACASRLRVAIGPAIAPETYTVDRPFQETFLSADPEAAPFFCASPSQDTLVFNLVGYATHQLTHQLAMRHVHALPLTTTRGSFFSRRKSLAHGFSTFGRNGSAILKTPKRP